MAKKKTAEVLKKVHVGARVSPDILAAMQVMADADDRTLSYMVEKAIREFVDRHKKGTHKAG
jgi:predicted transcriptional regulator